MRVSLAVATACGHEDAVAALLAAGTDLDATSVNGGLWYTPPFE